MMIVGASAAIAPSVAAKATAGARKRSRCSFAASASSWTRSERNFAASTSDRSMRATCSRRLRRSVSSAGRSLIRVEPWRRENLGTPLNGGGGWIRTNVAITAADLQSAPFSHSGTPPRDRTYSVCRLLSTLRRRRAARPAEIGRAPLRRGRKRLARLRAVQQPGELGAFGPHHRRHLRPVRRSRARVVRSASGGLAASAAGLAQPVRLCRVGSTAFTMPASCAIGGVERLPQQQQFGGPQQPGALRQQQAGRCLGAQAQIDERATGTARRPSSIPGRNAAASSCPRRPPPR